MSSHRIGETGLSDSGPSSTHHHHLPYAVLHGMNNNPSTSFMNQEGPAFDFGELEEAIVLQGVKIRNDEAKASLFTGRPAATLEMFPSWPIRFQQTPRGSSKSGGGESTEDSGSALNTLSSKADALLEPESPISIKVASSSDHHQAFDQNHLQLQQIEMMNDTRRRNFTAATTPPESVKFDVWRNKDSTRNGMILSALGLSPHGFPQKASFH